MANTFKLKSANNLTTSLATKYTVPSSTTAVVLSISFANTSNASKTVDIQIVSDTSDTETNATVFLTKDTPIPATSALELLAGNKIVLQATDVLKVDSDVAGKIDATLSIMEIT